MDNSYLIAGAVVVALFVIPKVLRSFRTISLQKARTLIAEGALIVDVRQAGEYRGGHVKNAVNVPLDNLSKIKNKAGLEQPVIVYCQSGARSASAAGQLKSMGYKNIYDMGGIHRWRG